MAQNKDAEKYSPIANSESYADSEELTGLVDAPIQPLRPSRRYGALIAIVLVIISTVQLFLTISLRINPPSTATTQSLHNNHESPCGSSSAEARANGCHWDYGLIAWVPDECYNPVLDAEFLSLNIPFEAYFDRGDGEAPDISRPFRDVEHLSEHPSKYAL